MTLFRRIRACLHRWTIALWLAGFKVIALFRRKQTCWEPRGGTAVAIIAPHPDDEVLGCGGVMAKHLAAGDSVSVIIVTDGRLSRAGGLTSAVMAKTRKAEANASASLLGLTELIMLDAPEGSWSANEIKSKLRKTLRKLSPAVVYAPSCLDYHPEHIKVAKILAGVVDAKVNVRVYTLHVPLNSLTNLIVDVSDQMNLLECLFENYATQTASLERGLRLRRYIAAIYQGGGSAEAYWSVTGEVYRRSNLDGALRPAVRGLRYWSFSDPLAFLCGGRARKLMIERSGAKS